ncbi:MAG: c-type cytochrome [Pseudomonadota bacterium]
MSRRLILFALPVIVVAAGAAWTLMAREHPPGDPQDAEQVAVGAALYAWNCARCHGQDMSGELGWVTKETGLTDEDIKEIADKLDDIAPAHDESGSTSSLDDAMLFRIIDEGPGKVRNMEDTRMPGFRDRLSDDEIWSLIAFMKSSWQVTKGEEAN